jgi:23S rRNA pseudouridine2604 synthase
MAEITINQFLTKHLPCPTKEAIAIIQTKKVMVNGLPAYQQQIISQQDTIIFDNKTLQEARPYFYYAYYKPRGIECTTDPEVKNNLSDVVPIAVHFFPIGRLDKESEGLLILTNDGKFYRKIAHADAYKEKEYLVTVDKALTEETLQHLSEGVLIMGRKTRVCQVKKINETSFNIILTQGLNRQIRRMCYKLRYEVLFLKRIRIDGIELGNLSPGELVEIEKCGYKKFVQERLL